MLGGGRPEAGGAVGAGAAPSHAQDQAGRTGADAACALAWYASMMRRACTDHAWAMRAMSGEVAQARTRRW